jgi:DNA-binding transcriptional regulator YiaG
MPNFAVVLKEEIARLARKELKRELEGLKKASGLYRSEIAALKRSVAALEKQVKRLGGKVAKGSDAGTGAETAGTLRFSAKGLFSQRKRLGLSAADMGKLLNVTAQTVYNWEAGKTRPRPSQLETVARVKKLGKRQANALLVAAGTEG